MLRNMDPPLGFGNKCPYRLAYKVGPGPHELCPNVSSH